MVNSLQFNILNLAGFFIFILLKVRILNRALKSPSLQDYLAYSYQDIFIFFILTFLIYKFLNKFRIIIIFIFFGIALNILFISKMGYPITSSLINQLGDFVFLQTSIQSPSIYRNILLLFAIFFFIALLFFILETKFIKKYIPLKPIIILNFIILTTSLVCYLIYPNEIDGRYSKNIFLSLIKPPRSVNQILQASYFKTAQKSQWKVASSEKLTIKNPYNIVFIIGETLTYQLDDDTSLKATFPNMMELEKNANVYTQHYTSWPYSSKSIFSIMCGNYPAPNSIIEMRLNKPKLCRSWNEKLIKELGYDNFLAHTGTLQYDNMKSLFKNIGYTNIFDKTNIDPNHRFKKNDLSIDDMSMKSSFSDWLDNKNSLKPFVATFITMNSHFPFWTPDESYKISKDTYTNTMHYQDYFIGELIKLLKYKKLYKDTIIVVTGDHGKRVSTESKSILPKSMFHIPLIIKVPKSKKKDTHYITNHAQIGGYLLELVSGQAHGFTEMNLNVEKNHLIFFETDQIYYSLLSAKKTSVLTPEGKIYSSSKGWPSLTSENCGLDKCSTYFNEYYSNLANLADWYGL